MLFEIEASLGQRRRAGRGRAGPGAIAARAAASTPRGASGRLSGRIDGVRSSATARSIAFSSSRTLPGHECAWSRAIAAPEIPITGFFICSANFTTKCSASSGMSSIRSRSDGSRTGITLIR